MEPKLFIKRSNSKLYALFTNRPVKIKVNDEWVDAALYSPMSQNPIPVENVKLYVRPKKEFDEKFVELEADKEKK
jgi:hypothetical protein